MLLFFFSFVLNLFVIFLALPPFLYLSLFLISLLISHFLSLLLSLSCSSSLFLFICSSLSLSRVRISLISCFSHKSVAYLWTGGSNGSRGRRGQRMPSSRCAAQGHYPMPPSSSPSFIFQTWMVFVFSGEGVRVKKFLLAWFWGNMVLEMRHIK